jgi:hypothetical protein
MNKLPPIIANDYNQVYGLVRVGYFTHANCKRPAQDGLLIVTTITWNET